MRFSCRDGASFDFLGMNFVLLTLEKNAKYVLSCSPLEFAYLCSAMGELELKVFFHDVFVLGLVTAISRISSFAVK